MQPVSAQKSSDALHPFDSPAAETIFKALLWVVVLLQALLLGREYNRHNQLSHRATPPQHRSR